MGRRSQIVLALAIVTASLASSTAQPPLRVVLTPPKPEPLAETKLLMDGLAQPNFRSLGRMLAEPPKDAEAWPFARGQALLLAETANLLMLRPPKSNREAEDLWLRRAGDLRDAAGKLALATALRDHAKAKAQLVEVANTCNRCHQSFRISARVAAFENRE